MSEFLTFELSDDNLVLNIFGNEEGLKSLISSIEKVIKYNDHDHLMTPSWAGYELSEEPQGENTKILNKVTIAIINEE